jgi:aminopeptidase YwaD
MTDEEGCRLAEYAGKEVLLESRARRIAAEGCNVIARKGTGRQRRIVVMAHIDAKMGTSGATDNAAGVIVLLLLAELLADYVGELGIELVAINGEDYFSNPGEQQYLALNAGQFNQIFLGINIDGVGYHKGATAYSLYDCPAETAGLINDMFAVESELVTGDPWYQGDHGLFLINDVAALALTSEYAAELMQTIIHTPKDSPAIVDTTKLVSVAQALQKLLLHLEQQEGVRCY